MDDLISRQKVLDLISIQPSEETSKGLLYQSVKQLPSEQPAPCAYWDRESNICALHRPSAQPEPQECEKCIFQPFKQFQQVRKKGKWAVRVIRGNWADDVISTCSECGTTFRNLDVANYCPNCGCAMEGEEEE